MTEKTSDYPSTKKAVDCRLELENYIVAQLPQRAEPEETDHSLLIESILNRSSLLVSSANLVEAAVENWREQWNRDHPVISREHALDLFALATKATLDHPDDDDDEKAQEVATTGGGEIQCLVPLPSAVLTGGWISDDNDLDRLVPVPWPPASLSSWFPPVATCEPTSDDEDLPPKLWDSDEYESGDDDDETPIHI